MTRPPIKALIVSNLLDTIEAALPNEGHRSDPEFLALCERIQGQVVELTFIGSDAFEAIDNNYWLPESCWSAVETKPGSTNAVVMPKPVATWHPIVDLPKEHFYDFVWVVSPSCPSPHLGFATDGRIQDALTVGDREGLSIEYEDDVTHFAYITEPLGPGDIAGDSHE
ncbi:hypothetical protein [Rosistilla oblonga]|uniref:hypothetical protein n=1 Tax=Rosistilla oblonga TaxID=2527990 RepID=UPI003A979A7B